MSDGIKVDYAEIDRLTTGITALNSFAGPLVPKVGALSVDGDLLASAILSPGTALAAEGAVMNASAQLSVTIVSSEALVIITASISKVYEAAEVALAAAAALADEAVDQALLIGGLPVTLVTVVDLLGVSLATGAFLEGGRALVVSLGDALGNPSSWQTSGGFAGEVARRFIDNFSTSNFSAWSLKAFETALGSHGDIGYDALLSLLLHQGGALRLFEDGAGTTSPSDLGNTLKKQNDLDQIATDVYGRAQQSEEDDYVPPLLTDENGNIVPRSVDELWAGAAQIDGIGAKEYGDLRVMRVDGPGGPRFVVQIPSTQVWDPRAGTVPNDVTSDVLAMRYGDSTTLAQTVRSTLDRIPEIRDGHAPVMLTGFSLGGITAGAIAEDPQGLNVQQVVTAGAPIGRMDIPDSTAVTSFEAREDPVARLDGATNPSRDGWNTISAPAPALSGHGGEQDFATAHNASRYAIMARQHPDSPGLAEVDRFLQGQQTVQDYRLERSAGK